MMSAIQRTPEPGRGKIRQIYAGTMKQWTILARLPLTTPSFLRVIANFRYNCPSKVPLFSLTPGTT